MAAQESSSLVSSWSYPFPPKDKATTIAPTEYLKGLANAEDGFFPLGQNGLWHGGIHFDRNTASYFDQDGGIRCIADGEIVAYRLNHKIQLLPYPNNNQAGYSSSFTLVRHRLALPPLAPSPSISSGAQATSLPTAIPAEDILVFFSLYMHLLPWEGYASGGATTQGAPKVIPDYYGVSKRYVVDTNANDPQLGELSHQPSPTPGIRVRKTPSGHGEIIGWLERGTSVTVGERHGDWGKISSFLEGSALNYHAGRPPLDAARTGWVYVPQMTEHEGIPSLDSVLAPTTANAVSAGALLGYVGEYQRLSEAHNHGNLPPKLGERPLVHVEIFTGQDITAFIARSKSRAQQLPNLPRTLLTIEPGAQFAEPIAPNGTRISATDTVVETSDSPPLGDWSRVQKVASAGHVSDGAFWIRRRDIGAQEERDTWTQFPLSTQTLSGPTVAFGRVASTANASFIQVGEQKWYYTYAADANDTAVEGWVCDSGHPHVSLKSPWDWPGFDVHSLTTPVPQMFQRGLHIADTGSPDEQTSFETAFDTARSDSAIKALEDAIDSQEQRDGKITAEELRRALQKPWLAERIDHMIVQYESEWAGPMSKWDALDSLMNSGLSYWQAEKSRISALQIWPAVAALHVETFPTSANVYHIHPVGLISNFLDPDRCRCGCCLEVIGTRFKKDTNTTWYGPLHPGKTRLSECAAVAKMAAAGTLSATERRILLAMADNEGKIETVQAIDKAIISAGAMQKTIRFNESRGELATQIAKFRDRHPAEYQQLFANCGWTVAASGSQAALSYTHPTFTNGATLKGDPLYDALRRDFSIETFKKPVKCPPVASMAYAVSHPLYQELQVEDFVDRLNSAINKVPPGYSHPIKDFFQSAVGRATVLDQDVNAQGYTTSSMKASLDRFFAHHPQVSRDPTQWGNNRNAYEQSILEDYGNSRYMAQVDGTSVAGPRYRNLVGQLGTPTS